MRRSVKLCAATAAGLLLAGCSGSGGDATDKAPEVTAADDATTGEITTADELPTAADLSDGLLSPAEMQDLYGVSGDFHPEVGIDQYQFTDQCGTRAAILGVVPDVYQQGGFTSQTEVQVSYNDYLGYYPGTAEDAFRAVTPAAGCADLRRPDGDSFRPLTPAVLAQTPAGVPTNFQLFAFTYVFGDKQISVHEAWAQEGDYVLRLYFETEQPASEIAMADYLVQALARFQEFVPPT